jgi:NADH-quinone oxidoreductase subunit L
MSQIGYMMLGAGLGAAGYAFAIFHLLTHGFFKANMFLGAGSVMHGMNDDVDMRRYGAVRHAMPITFLTFTMGYLAIIGFPGFSGFWSKDKIIETALADSWVVGLCALVGAGITGFYMTRLMLLTFFTDKRWKEGVHPHESPAVMTAPLIVLAALSVLGGVMLINDWIVDFLSPVVGAAPEVHPPLSPLAITLMVVAVVALGVVAAWFLVGRREVSLTPPRDVSFGSRPRGTSRSPPVPRAPTSTGTTSTTRSWSTPDGTWCPGCSGRIATAWTASSPAAPWPSVPSPASCAASRTGSSAPMPSPCSAASCSSSWPSWR